tara:strand:- start:232 stop:486 length:255 start_codon:yes stop_codon:yes gene_type:complete
MAAERAGELWALPPSTAVVLLPPHDASAPKGSVLVDPSGLLSREIRMRDARRAALADAIMGTRRQGPAPPPGRVDSAKVNLSIN